MPCHWRVTTVPGSPPSGRIDSFVSPPPIHGRDGTFLALAPAAHPWGPKSTQAAIPAPDAPCLFETWVEGFSSTITLFIHRVPAATSLWVGFVRHWGARAAHTTGRQFLGGRVSRPFSRLVPKQAGSQKGQKKGCL